MRQRPLMVVLAVAALSCGGCRGVVPPLPPVKTGGFQPAVKRAIESALEEANAKPDDAGASGRLGMVLHAHEQWGGARDAYMRAAALDAKSFDWTYYLAAVLSQLGRNEDAAAAWERALAINSSYVPAQLKLADALFTIGKTGEAKERYLRILSASPANGSAWYGLGRAKAAMGDTAGAIEAFEEACRLYPNFGGAHYGLSQALRKAGRNGETAPHLAIYEKHKTDAPPLHDPRMDAIEQLNTGATGLIRRGIEMEQAGRIAEAIEAHEAAAQADPKSEQPWINLIQLYGRSGDAARAETSYRRAVEINANRDEAHYNYGVFLFGQKRFGEARAAFERVVALNPAHAAAQNNLGYLLEQSGNQREAAHHYELAIAADPNYRLAHFHLGRLLVSQHRYAGAIAHLEKTIAPDDESTPGYLYALGAALARAGESKRAVARLEEARSRAQARTQMQLLAAIERDLKLLSGAKR